MKSKNHALLGIAVTSGAGSGLNNAEPPINYSVGPGSGSGGGSSGSGGSGGGDDDDRELTAYGVYDLEAATKLELDKGDAVNLLESHTPSTEYQAFNDSLIRRGLLVFGLSFSFYNSEKSSYSSMKQDRAEFKFSIQRFMRQMCGVRGEVTRWVLPQIIRDYGLKWEKSGQIPFEWIPQADPWLEEDKEVSSALDRIAGGLSSPQRECKRRGVDFSDVVRENREAQRMVREFGVVMTLGKPGAMMFNSGNMGAAPGAEAVPDQEETENGEE
ncbi:hypothetical protein SDC9_160441 [bioreactor metagenome]|uniref:Phage portal protein n=1 Tax=bioreactor metagenome TaxID=1076179 RepID=A0A645FFH8_9ZZZZ